MSKTLSARMSDVETTVAGLLESSARQEAMLERLLAHANPAEPAKASKPAKPAKAADQPKADVKFRSAKAIEKGHERERELYAAAYAAAGVKRFKDLTPAQQKAVKADVRAMWDGIKGTRKTKVA